MLKAVILVGGPQNDIPPFSVPKPLTLVAQLPVIQHHIEACRRIKGLEEVLMIGFYPPSKFDEFTIDMQNEYRIKIRYLRQRTLHGFGTAGDLNYYQKEILSGNPLAFFVLQGNICTDFLLEELLEFHQSKSNSLITVMGVKLTKDQSLNCDVMVVNDNNELIQYNSENTSFDTSSIINSGVYIFSCQALGTIENIFKRKYPSARENLPPGNLEVEKDVLPALVGTNQIFVFQSDKWWYKLTDDNIFQVEQHYVNLYKSKPQFTDSTDKAHKMLKAVILVGGPQKGTRFRPLSFDIPKPLFPVAGLPVIQHHIEACKSLEGLDEILIIGFYPSSKFYHFIINMQNEYKIKIKYLREHSVVGLGTAGGLHSYRDEIRNGKPSAVFVMNGDVCSDFPLKEMYEFHKSKTDALITIMGTEATKCQALNYGCIATNKDTQEITHYVEKPNTYVSALINCGVYVFALEAFTEIEKVFEEKQQDIHRTINESVEPGFLQLEQDVLTPLAGTGKLFAFQTSNWWCQLKNASSAVFANRCYLHLYKTRYPERLQGPNQENGDKSRSKIISDVYVHPTATIHSTAVLGPNVSIGGNVIIDAGVRIRESIVLEGAHIGKHSLIIHSIIGRDSNIGEWARVEGTPADPDPNKPFAKMENTALFNYDGRLNPTITVLGLNVVVPSETVLLNSIVLPNKILTKSIKNEIIL